LGHQEAVEAQESPEFEFVAVDTWPDEDKPKAEATYRRARPIAGSWVLLGNDELWLIPEVQFLGRDIKVHEVKSLLGGLKVRFKASYRAHLQLRELLMRITGQMEGESLVVAWEDAYLAMYLALRVNYKIPSAEVNRIGLLREDHWPDVLAALLGGVKKKTS